MVFIPADDGNYSGAPALDDNGRVIDITNRPVPAQNFNDVILHADRFRRAADVLRPWSELAKKCVDFFENQQWDQTDLVKLADEGRPALCINMIRPLVRVVMGYFLNNQTDIDYLPGNDGTGTADVARVLSQVSKQISQNCEKPFVDAEVFLDGMLTGRGFFDSRLDFERNIFGEVKHSSVDPFSVYLDPDGDKYDLNEGSSFLDVSRFVSVDEVEHFYGVNAANLIRPLASGVRFESFPSSLYEGASELSPWRTFGGDKDGAASWESYSNQFYDWVDGARKTIRLLDIQHYKRVMRWFFIDLETGIKRPVPDAWGPDEVQRVIAWAKANNEPLVVQRQKTRRLRWTHMVGDIIVYDEWSPYDTFTVTPFFPYFRRGKTMGMVEPLLDPQREVNVRRSARQNIIGRSSNGGWMFEKGTLTPQERANLEKNGGRPGFTLEYQSKDGRQSQPTQIQPAQNATGIADLEKEAAGNLKEIAGINDSALGQVDQSTLSGVAIQARQQQTVIGFEADVRSWHRSQRLIGKKQLEIVQQHYTETRVLHIVGPGSSSLAATINHQVAGRIVNDVTIGSYAVSIDETSMNKSFLAGQFKELVDLKQLGIPIPDDQIIDASSIGRKEELRAAVAQSRAAQAQAAAAGAVPPPAGGGGPGGSRTAPDGGSLPSGPEKGAPPPPAGLGAPAGPPIAPQVHQ